jgi:hypothetical protein
MNDMTLFSAMCFALIGLLFSAAICFGGYRLFMILLPIWGFIFGFGFGAQTMQAIFGTGFLATTSSWVVGLIVAVVFAAASYLFWFFAVALLSASFGYSVGMAIMGAITPNLAIVNWIVAVALAVVVAFVVLRFNIQKWAIIAITAMLGAGAMIGTILVVTGNAPPDALVANPVALAIQNSFWWLIFFLGMSAAGIVTQFRTTQAYTIDEYNRMVMTGESAA